MLRYFSTSKTTSLTCLTRGENKMERSAKTVESKIDQSTPKIDQCRPRIDQCRPRIDQSTTRTDQPTPRIDQSTPRIDQSTSRIDQSTSRIDQSTPEKDQSTPRTDQPTPRIDQSTPRIDQSTPRTDQSTPRGRYKSLVQRPLQIIGTDAITNMLQLYTDWNIGPRPTSSRHLDIASLEIDLSKVFKPDEMSDTKEHFDFPAFIVLLTLKPIDQMDRLETYRRK
ncbi:hypothetical protein Btru_025886 [Bulinus truncatus]|nr:hypothetical protein Btru_025886 [Bulinus truncatus]